MCALIDGIQGQLRLDYSDWLQSLPWDYFVTITCRADRRDPLAFLRDIEAQEISERIRRGFWAIEPHKRGEIHAHGIIAVYHHVISTRYSGDHDLASPYQFWANFFRSFGRSRVDCVRSRENVTGYCSKYVTKPGGFDYGFEGASPRAWRKPHRRGRRG